MRGEEMMQTAAAGAPELQRGSAARCEALGERRDADGKREKAMPGELGGDPGPNGAEPVEWRWR